MLGSALASSETIPMTAATSVVSAATSVTIKINRIAIAFPYNGGM